MIRTRSYDPSLETDPLKSFVEENAGTGDVDVAWSNTAATDFLETTMPLPRRGEPTLLPQLDPELREDYDPQAGGSSVAKTVGEEARSVPVVWNAFYADSRIPVESLRKRSAAWLQYPKQTTAGEYLETIGAEWVPEVFVRVICSQYPNLRFVETFVRRDGSNEHAYDRRRLEAVPFDPTWTDPNGLYVFLIVYRVGSAAAVSLMTVSTKKFVRLFSPNMHMQEVPSVRLAAKAVVEGVMGEWGGLSVFKVNSPFYGGYELSNRFIGNFWVAYVLLERARGRSASEVQANLRDFDVAREFALAEYRQLGQALAFCLKSSKDASAHEEYNSMFSETAQNPAVLSVNLSMAVIAEPPSPCFSTIKQRVVVSKPVVRDATDVLSMASAVMNVVANTHTTIALDAKERKQVELQDDLNTRWGEKAPTPAWRRFAAAQNAPIPKFFFNPNSFKTSERHPNYKHTDTPRRISARGPEVFDALKLFKD